MVKMDDNKPISIPTVLTVKQLAERLDRSVAEVIGILVRYGIMANINQDIDFDTASVVAEELMIPVVAEEIVDQAAARPAKMADSISRPPVVTVMGHVDHGKTSLLDTIRNTNVAAGEAGGITQAISSYQVAVADPEKSGQERLITFVDTPGHSAFEAMRKHGVSITDLVVLVVAANDGVKPQTKEAIAHAKALAVPVVVAINKIDLPGADPERVKRELSENGLQPEEWGGKVPVVAISATKNENIEKLLEVILLVTDLLELKTDPKAPAAGVVVESHMEAGLGPVATVLVQNGTLMLGQAIVIGAAHGKIRSLEDHRGKRIRQATAATPVLISGLSSVPSFGDRLVAVSDEKEARDIGRQNAAVSRRTNLAVSVGQLSQSSKEKDGYTELSLIIKADTQGSLNAVTELVGQIGNEDVRINIIKSGVGAVSEEDISRAKTEKATVLGFNLKTPADMKRLAQEYGVKIHNFSVIYELQQLVERTVVELMPDIEEEREMATFQILRRFHNNRKHPVLGGLLVTGVLKIGQPVKIYRRGVDEAVATGKIVALRIGQEEKETVKEGSECGVEISVFAGQADAISEKDKLVVFITEKVKKTA